jgi:hypothetical protein
MSDVARESDALILHRLGTLESQQRAVEGKLDRVLERHETRIQALENWRAAREGELKIEREQRDTQRRFTWGLLGSTAFLAVKALWDLVAM